MTKTHLFKTILFMAIALLLASGAQALTLGADGSNVAWNVDVANDGVQLSVSGPDGFVWEHTYEAGEVPSFSIFDKNGYVFPEGQYTWELTIIPALDDATRKAMLAARESGDHVALAQLEKSLGQRHFSGTFRVEGGSVMLPTEMPEMLERLEKAQATDQALEKDFVINDDLIVTFSACIGNDCVNGESFGFDTIRLKENNLRIKFQDTSTSGSFPTNDWELLANDSANGGQNKFSIVDVDGGRTPFTIEAGAPNHTIYGDSTGRLGVGTSNPVLQIHTADGNSPGLRLEQDGSAGFQPQVWDIAGNEANFFVRDVTSGSRLPFRIRPGAPNSSIDIAADGDVGMGTASPAGPLHVVRTTSGAKDMLILANNGPSRFLLDNTNVNAEWRFNADDGKALRIAENNTNTDVEFILTDTGDLTITGTLTENSSVHAKENFQVINGQSILARVLELPISSWNYRKDPATIRHMGPMAQDFFAAFGLGHTAEGIAPRNLSAVALAAIQGLHEKLDAETAEVERLQARLAALEERLGLE